MPSINEEVNICWPYSNTAHSLLTLAGAQQLAAKTKHLFGGGFKPPLRLWGELQSHDVRQSPSHVEGEKPGPVLRVVDWLCWFAVKCDPKFLVSCSPVPC